MRLINFNSKVTINLQDPKWSCNSISVARKVITACKLKKFGLSIVLSNNKCVQILNNKWRGENKPTNVLSFPNDKNSLNNFSSKNYLGDIILAYETLKKESIFLDISFINHLSHLLIHGILHLKGYDHESRYHEMMMQAEEIKILKVLNIHNPYKAKRLV